MLLEAAEVIDGIRGDVVVIGAIAVQVALADSDVVLTPTRDVDAGVATDAAERVVAHLEDRCCGRATWRTSVSVTWVKDTRKIQLLCPFHPSPKGAARGLPVSNIVSELTEHRIIVAFDTEPERGRFWIAVAGRSGRPQGSGVRSHPVGGLVSHRARTTHGGGCSQPLRLVERGPDSSGDRGHARDGQADACDGVGRAAALGA
jgi:hypothetical protein